MFDSFKICHQLPLNQVNFSLAEKKNRKNLEVFTILMYDKNQTMTSSI